jgi:hypothetical protein
MTSIPARSALAAALLVACIARTAPSEEPKGSWNQKLRVLQEEVLVLGVLHRLHLDKKQLGCLLHCAYMSRGAHEVYEKACAELNPKFEEACIALKKEDEAYRGLTQKVMGRAGKLEHQLKVEQKKMFDTVNLYEKKFTGALRPVQDAVVKNLENMQGLRGLLRFLAPARLGRGQEKRRKAVRVELETIRGYSKARWKEKEADVIGTYVAAYEKYHKPLDEEGRKRYRQQLSILFEEVRKMDAEVLAASVSELSRRMLPSDRVETLRKELRDIQKLKYGGIGVVGKFMLLPRLIPVLEERLGLAPGRGAPAEYKSPGPAKTKKPSG